MVQILILPWEFQSKNQLLEMKQALMMREKIEEKLLIKNF